MALPWFALFILVIEVVHNFLIGLLLPEEFSAGFIFGDLAVLVIVGSALWSAMPSAVLGLIAALVVVLVGLIIKAEGDRHPKREVRRNDVKAKP
jgi:flagellar biosynthesis component FlhA